MGETNALLAFLRRAALMPLIWAEEFAGWVGAVAARKKDGTPRWLR